MVETVIYNELNTIIPFDTLFYINRHYRQQYIYKNMWVGNRGRALRLVS